MQPLALQMTASVQVERLALGGNALTGPAFPAGWLQLGAMPNLLTLSLHGSPGLTGTLPATLSWPKLEFL